jgi:hypothetical protein
MLFSYYFDDWIANQCILSLACSSACCIMRQEGVEASVSQRTLARFHIARPLERAGVSAEEEYRQGIAVEGIASAACASLQT